MIKLKDLKAKVEGLSDDDKQFVNDVINLLNTGVPFKELDHFREFVETQGIDKAIEAKAKELEALQARKDELKAKMGK